MLTNDKDAIAYSITTLLATAAIGQILLWLFPNGASAGSSILFIAMNLVPMMTAAVFSIRNAECEGLFDFLRQSLLRRERLLTFLLALMVPCVYYGVSALLGNVRFTNASVMMVLAYFPWTLLQGGLEEVGWRWYLQDHIHVRNNSFVVKMLLISIVWFLWHIPIYRLPWITSASSDYVIFYAMILGNTFTLGMIKEYSQGAVPCILAHMLIDTMAAAMLVQSSLPPIIVLVAIEIACSTLMVGIGKGRK